MTDVTCNPIYYVAGPMTGYPEFNFPAFQEATKRLRDLGCEVFSPAENIRNRGFNPTNMTGFEDLATYGFNLRDVLAGNTNILCRESTHIFMLPGWYKSLGATAERTLGLALGFTIEGAAA